MARLRALLDAQHASATTQPVNATDKGQSGVLRVASPTNVARNNGPDAWVQAFVRPDYLDDLERVAAYYRTPPDEIQIMKQMAAADPIAARECFRAVAQMEGLI